MGIPPSSNHPTNRRNPDHMAVKAYCTIDFFLEIKFLTLLTYLEISRNQDGNQGWENDVEKC